MLICVWLAYNINKTSMIYKFFNIGTRLVILFFCVDFDGFNDGVLPGVFLLSR
jgi:hypothetical protein